MALSVELPGLGYPYHPLAEVVGLPPDYFKALGRLPPNEREEWAVGALEAFGKALGETVGGWLRGGGDMPPTGLWDAPVRAVVDRDREKDRESLRVSLEWAGVKVPPPHEGATLGPKGHAILTRAVAALSRERVAPGGRRGRPPSPATKTPR